MRCGSVRFGLALIQIVDFRIAAAAFAGEDGNFVAVFYILAIVRFATVLQFTGFARFVRFGLPVSALAFAYGRERFTRQQINRLPGGDSRHCGGMRFAVTVAVIVVFEIFENIADIQEGVAIQADVHESGLHARKHPRDAALVDTADQRELFFALDVNFD